MSSEKALLPKIKDDDFSSKPRNTSSVDEEPIIWRHPFYKGFMYTAGVASAILLASVILIIIKYTWPEFELFPILN